MHTDSIWASARPLPLAGGAMPASPTPPIAAPEPETRGLTRDELRRIVLDIVG